MKKMKQFIRYTALLAFAIFLFFEIDILDNFEILLLVYFLPSFITYTISYVKYLKAFKHHDSIIISKSSYNYETVIFLVLVSVFSFYVESLLGGIAILLSIIILFFEYSISKRMLLRISKKGVENIAKKDKSRALEEITFFEIHGNNIEIRFNHSEILQINKNQLLLPKWEVFVNEMADLKKHLSINESPTLKK